MTSEEFIAAIEKKGNFIFELSWYYDYFRDTTDKEFGQIMRAVCEFTLSGNLQDFEDRGLNIIARAMKTGIEKQTEGYIKRCNQNAKNGAKGGEAKAQKRNHDELTEKNDWW